MDRFPKLKTGAGAQYPSMRHLRFATETNRFLDSSEQRFADFRGGKRSWRLHFDRLTPTELAEIRNFFILMRGSRTAFEFEDPWTGIVVSPCRFDQDTLSDVMRSESSEGLVVTIRED